MIADNLCLERAIVLQVLRRGLFGIVIVLLSQLAACHSQYPLLHPEAPAVPPLPKPMPPIEVALVLGAGGARGLAHVGVLEVLENAGVPIDLIVGSSAGSIIGGLYADSLCASCVQARLQHLTRQDLLDPSFRALLQSSVTIKGPIEGLLLERFLAKNLSVKNFDQLKLPLTVVSTSLDDNTLTVIRSGPLVPAIHASSALPPLFTPVHLYGSLLVDGGVLAPVPVNVAQRYKPKLIIAVDISAPPPTARLHNGFDVMYRALYLSYNELSRIQSDSADVVIRPNLLNYGTFEEGHNDELYQAGLEEARNMLPKIKELLSRRGIALKPRPA